MTKVTYVNIMDRLSIYTATQYAVGGWAFKRHTGRSWGRRSK